MSLRFMIFFFCFSFLRIFLVHPLVPRQALLVFTMKLSSWPWFASPGILFVHFVIFPFPFRWYLTDMPKYPRASVTNTMSPSKIPSFRSSLFLIALIALTILSNEGFRTSLQKLSLMYGPLFLKPSKGSFLLRAVSISKSRSNQNPWTEQDHERQAITRRQPFISRR